MVVLVRPYRRSARGCDENPFGMGHVQAFPSASIRENGRNGVEWTISRRLSALICRSLLLPGPRPLQCRDPDSSLRARRKQFRPKPMFTPRAGELYIGRESRE